MRILRALCVVAIVSATGCGEVKPAAVDAAVDGTEVDTPPGDIDAAVDAPMVMPTVTVTRIGTSSGTVVSSVGGINCGATCSGQVALGTVMVLSATPDPGATFGGWTGGGCSGTAPNCTITVAADVTVRAQFDVATHGVTVSLAGNGLGNVTSTPAGINCPGTCTMTVDHGTQVTLTATPMAGSLFLGWSGSTCSGTGPCVLTVDGDKSVNASFALNQSLVVTKSGTGTGTVTSAPAGINCGADCSETYAPATVVTLTAAASADSTFTGWSGGGCSGTGGCTVTVNAATTVDAQFTLRSYTLTAAKTGTGAGTVTSNPAGINCGTDCSEIYNHGTVVALTASASTGSTFTGWSGGGCSGSGGCTVTLTAATTVTATFTLNQYTLTAAKNGTGTGTVTSSPAGISCGTDCSEVYNHGTVISLTAAPSGASTFAGWAGGGCTGTGGCTVTLTAATTVTATFNGGTVTPNYVFVTSTATTGSMGGLAGADLICRNAAAAAALPGTYRAWMSTSTVNALSRLGTASGWIRTDGKPFANTQADLVAGRIYYPILTDEAGTARPFATAWTGTGDNGLWDGGNECGDWTNTTGVGVTSGGTLGVTGDWTALYGNPCTASLNLYCFGIDRAATVTVTPAAGRKIFISAGSFTPGGGIAAADAICANEATGAGLSGTFKALLATTTASAASRFSTTGTPWVRTDGVPLTATAAELFAAATQTYLTSPTLQANGTTYVTYNPRRYLWSGATGMNAVGTAASTCSNWTSAVASLAPQDAELGIATPSTLFGGIGYLTCASTGIRLMCMQQ